MPHSEVTRDQKNRIAKKLGARIREARVRAGMSQAKLSRNCGMTARNVRYIETGERSFHEGTVFLIRVAAALDITLRELFEGTYVPTSPLEGRK